MTTRQSEAWEPERVADDFMGLRSLGEDRLITSHLVSQLISLHVYVWRLGALVKRQLRRTSGVPTVRPTRERRSWFERQSRGQISAKKLNFTTLSLKTIVCAKLG